ncbi:MAG: glycosyltransferase [Candidatus Pacearchaeota archaeon]
MIDIIIPTLGKPHLKECLRYLKKNTKVPYRLFLIKEGKSWPEAINIGLKKCKLKNDIVLMDDDVRVLPGWLDDIEEYKKKADIIGFKLLFPNGKIQHAGAFVTYDPIRVIYDLLNGKYPPRILGLSIIGKNENREKYNKPLYVPHVTTSLVYIKKEVFKKIGGMNEFGGYQFEDVDFDFRALKAGFKIMYCPNRAIHLLTHTKKNFKDFRKKAHQNYIQIYKKWFKNKNFINFLKKNNFIKFKIWKFWIN